MIRILLADDQMLVRTGLRMILDGEPDLQVVAEAGDGGAAVRETERGPVDVVLMDIRMPGTDGIEATRRIVAQGAGAPSVLVLTTYDSDEYVFQALRAGAAGFLLKHTSPELLVQAVRAVAAGEGLIAPSVTRRLIAEFARTTPASPTMAEPAELAGLTAREREVLDLIVGGLSNAEIAAALVVSDATVKTHVGRVLTKLGVRDRVQAVIYAYEHGLVPR
jgi:DNA-binding NarL/FixJ family response regulator